MTLGRNHVTVTTGVMTKMYRPIIWENNTLKHRLIVRDEGEGSKIHAKTIINISRKIYFPKWFNKQVILIHFALTPVQLTFFLGKHHEQIILRRGILDIKMHVGVINKQTNRYKFALTWVQRSRGAPAFSLPAHIEVTESRRPLLLRVCRHRWSFSSPLLCWDSYSLSLSNSLAVAAVSDPRPPSFTCIPRQRSPLTSAGWVSVHKIFSANPPTHAN